MGSGFHWQEYNNLEFEECGLSLPIRERAVELFTRSMKTGMLLLAGTQTQMPASLFFTTAFNSAVGLASIQAQREPEVALHFDEIVHALAHYARNALAQHEWNKSAAAFEAAVSEMIDAQG